MLSKSNTENLQRYPGWKSAEDKILKLVKSKGYGYIVSLQELHDYMEMEEPETLDAYKKYQFEWLGSVENLKESLLEKHSICLMNLRGQGYIICTPDDQVSKAVTKIMKKVGLGIDRAAATLFNVKKDLLSGEGNKVRIENMAKVAFVKQAMSKKKLKSEKKQIIE